MNIMSLSLERGVFSHEITLNGEVVDIVQNYAEAITPEQYIFEAGVKLIPEVLKYAQQTFGIKTVTRSKSTECKINIDDKNITTTGHLPKNITIKYNIELTDNMFMINRVIPSLVRNIKEGYIIFNKSLIDSEDLVIELPASFKVNLGSNKNVISFVKALFK